MNEFSALRQVISQKVLNAAGATPIQMPNAPFTQPTGSPWLNFYLKTGKTMQAELGSGTSLELTAGVLEIDVFTPEKTGDGAAIALADTLKQHINRKSWIVPPNSYVNLDAATILTDLPVRSGWYWVKVQATFCFYHRNPNAEPFTS